MGYIINHKGKGRRMVYEMFSGASGYNWSLGFVEVDPTIKGLAMLDHLLEVAGGLSNVTNMPKDTLAISSRYCPWEGKNVLQIEAFDYDIPIRVFIPAD